MRSLTILVLLINLVLITQSQNDSIDIIKVELIDTRIVSDGISRYTEPKISPDGKKILTTRNLDTLIYIDLENNIEKVLLTGGRFYRYYWIDSNIVYFYIKKPSKTETIVELGELTIDSLIIETDFSFRGRIGTLPNIGRIPIKYKGKYDLKNDLKRDKIYRIENEHEIELTPLPGTYYNYLISNNEERIIIHKNDGKAYNYDFNGSGDYFMVAKGIVTSWSPDDKYLLYFHDREGERGKMHSELYICTSNGEKATKITNTKDLTEMYADWARNCQKITFWGEEKNQIYISTIKIE